MFDRTRWTALNAWGLETIHEETGVRLEWLDTASLTTIIVRRGQEAQLERRLREHFGCSLAPTAKVFFAGANALVWSAPGQWLAVTASGQSPADLPTVLDGIAAVTDQSDSRALVKVSGARARETLAKGFAIDLHPKAFATGSTAVTKAAHLSVQIWQTEEAPTYVIAVPRSYATGFRSWLTAASLPS